MATRSVPAGELGVAVPGGRRADLEHVAERMDHFGIGVGAREDDHGRVHGRRRSSVAGARPGSWTARAASPASFGVMMGHGVAMGADRSNRRDGAGGVRLPRPRGAGDLAGPGAAGMDWPWIHPSPWLTLPPWPRVLMSAALGLTLAAGVVATTRVAVARFSWAGASTPSSARSRATSRSARSCCSRASRASARSCSSAGC